ncbi:CHASE2 domain-containing protein [Desulfobacterales bacterium HSG2]|nr:CHASE2 domain-containing protein [Desulfobacterales bacterium HSG2]
MKFFRLLRQKAFGRYIASAIGFVIIALRLHSVERWFSQKRGRRFWLNVMWGVLIAISLHFVSTYTGIGQQLLNETYDYLMREDFQQSGWQKEPISDAIRLIAFNKETYEKSPNKGLWTPRDLLGETILKAVRLGAKVVVVDISPHKPSPFYIENQFFLIHLREAADLAEKTGAVILLPWVPAKPPTPGEYYTSQYNALLNEKKNVIQFGAASVFYNAMDLKVRHFRFYQRLTRCPNCRGEIPLNAGKCPVCEYPHHTGEYKTWDREKQRDRTRAILSLPVLAALYQWHGLKAGRRIRENIEAKVNRLDEMIPVPSHDNSIPAIQLHPQNASGECLPARYKFRIASRETVTRYGGRKGYNPLAKILWTPDILPDTLREKTVIIGSVYDEPVGDIHSTALGRMPGLFLVANAVNLFLRGEQIHENLPLKIGLIALLIILSALVFTRMPSVLAALSLTVLLLLFNTPVSIRLFTRYGLFLDFWIIIFGIGIFENLAGAVELLQAYLEKQRDPEPVRDSLKKRSRPGKRIPYLRRRKYMRKINSTLKRKRKKGGKRKMMRRLLTIFMICFSAISLLPEGHTAESPPIVGYVKAADQDYKVLRNGKPVKLSPLKGVCNGDVIIPAQGKSVKLDYRYCDEKRITGKTTVECAVTEEKPGWFRDFFSNLMETLTLKGTRTIMEENDAFAPQNRDKHGQKGRPCFPAPLFQVFPLPFNHATLLQSDKPVIFRWEDPLMISALEASECSDVNLIITKAGEKPMPPVPMKVGEMKEIKSSRFQPAASYQWHVEARGKKSDTYHFRILSENASQKIRSEMKAAAESDIHQALWLQLRSDLTPEPDLYTDSLRIMTGLRGYQPRRAEVPVLEEINRRVFAHCR